MDDGIILLGSLLFYGFVVGICLGSFATALIWRVPRHIPWIYSKEDKNAVRSICPSCNTILGPLDLIPVFSWMFLKGKCRHCHTSISPIYPLTEVACGCVGATVFIVFGVSVLSVFLSFILLFAWVFIWVGIRSFYWSGTIFAILTFLVIGLGIAFYFTDTAVLNKIYSFTGF